MWNFRNNEKSFVNDVIRPKSSFSSSNKDVISLLMVKKPKVSFDIGSITIKEKHISLKKVYLKIPHKNISVSLLSGW